MFPLLAASAPYIRAVENRRQWERWGSWEEEAVGGGARRWKSKQGAEEGDHEIES